MGRLRRFFEIGHRGHWQVVHKQRFIRHLSVSPVPNLGKTTRSPPQSDLTPWILTLMAKQQQWFLQKTAEEWLANSGQPLTVASWNNHLFLLCKNRWTKNGFWLKTLPKYKKAHKIDAIISQLKNHLVLQDNSHNMNSF